MGITASKATPASLDETAVKTEKVEIDKDNQSTHHDILLDPRSPDVNRTPLTGILGNRLKDRQNADGNSTMQYLHKRLLNVSAKEMKLLDPRSPSKFIPRTPLNMSLDGEFVENSVNQYSHEYSGCIEEASCRNFNERLANMTFDDSYELKEKEHTAPHVNANESAANLNTVQPDNHNSPVISLQTLTSRFGNDENDEPKISPVVESMQRNKHNVGAAFSSTPIVPANTQLKHVLLKNKGKNQSKLEIFNDGVIENAQVTPAKRVAKGKENENVRTPFGSLLNRHIIGDENTTPISKPAAKPVIEHKVTNKINIYQN